MAVRFLLAGFIVAMIVGPGLAQQPSASLAAPRFQARWIDGHVDTGELTGWNDPAGDLVYRGQKVLAGETTVRWLQKVPLTAPMKELHGVELVGGDFIAGDVVGSSSGTDKAAHGEPVLLIQPAASYDVPGMPRRNTIAIALPWVQRIIWNQAKQSRFEPQSAWLRDGRKVHYRSIHWNGDGVRFLTDDKIETVQLDQLAELHLVARDPWQTHLDLLAAMNSDCAGKLVHIQAAGNLRLTTSSHCLRLWSSGQNRPPAEQLIIGQPAWTTAGLAIALGAIERITLFSADELPLTRLTLSKSQHRGFVLDHLAQEKIDANVLGGRLQSGGGEYAWGFGVHAEHLLEFQLPDLAQRVQTWAGLDHAAGNGGCARAAIEILSDNHETNAGPAAQTSPMLVGSDDPPSRLQLDLPKNPRGSSVLRLIADPVLTDRPRGADPFEVRDFVDLLEPLVVLDHEGLLRVVRENLPRSLPELQGWNVEGEWQTISQWRPGGRPMPGFRREILIGKEPLILSGMIAVPSEQPRLVVWADQLPGKSSAVELRVRIDGRPALKVNLPLEGDGETARPVVVDLLAYAGRTANAELEFRSEKSKASFRLSRATVQSGH